MKQSIAGIILSNGTFLIGLRLAGGEMGNRWEFPGGKVDPGETPEIAILREFQEELGVSVSIGKPLTSVEFTNRGGLVELLAYQIFLPEGQNILLSEHSEIKWATLDEIEKLDFVDSDRLLIPFLKKWCMNEYDAKI